MINLLKQHKGIVLLLIVAATLRFSISEVHGYSNDELSAINRLRFDNFSELIDKGVMQGDMHPAGVQVFLKGWSSLVGTSEFALRIPFVVCGLLSVLLVYILGLRWHGKNAGLFAAGLMAVLYFPVLQSEFARPYAPGLFFTLLSALFIEKVLFCACNKWRDTVLLGIAFAAGTYTHYFCTVTIAWMYLTGLIFINRNNFKYYFIAGVLAFVLHLPHIGITLFHTSREGGLQWLGAPEADWLFQFLFYAFNESWWVVGMVSLLVFLAFIFRSGEANPSKRFFVLCVLWFFGIYLVGHLLSVTLTPVLKFPILLFAFPFFLLLIAMVLSRVRWPKIVLSLCLGVIGFSTVREKDLYGNMHFENFREIAEKMVEWKQKYGDENIYTIFNVNNPDYLNFYANRLGDTLTFDRDTIGWGESTDILFELREREEQYCVVGYSGRVTTVDFFETVQEEYSLVAPPLKMNNSGVFLMARNPNHIPYQYQERASISFYTYLHSEEWTNEDHIELDSAVGGLEMVLNDSVQMFGPSYSLRVGDIIRRDEGYLNILVSGRCDSCEVTITISARRNGELVQEDTANFWRGKDIDRQMQADAPDRFRNAQFSFELPSFLEENDTLEIGLWRRNNKIFYLSYIGISWAENIWN